jgi:hypothetical protein
MKIKKYFEKVFIIGFIIIFGIPFVGLFFQGEPHSFPNLNFKKFSDTDFRLIEDWHKDHVFLIHQLSKFWSNMNYKLGNSTKPGQVIIGKNGWLFLGNDYEATIDQYTGRNAPSEEEMMLSLNAIKNMNKIAMKHNIPFLVLVIPDKHEIYQEYLPKEIKSSTENTRMYNLQQAMVDNGIDFIDIKQAEFEAKNTLAKKNGDLYLKGDSHWNYLGAYAAYKPIIAYMKKKKIKVQQQHINFIPGTIRATDLAGFLQLSIVESNNPLPDVKNLNLDILGRDASDNEQVLGPYDSIGNEVILKQPYQVINRALNNNQTCLLIGDSFSRHLGFYFHNDFQNTVQIHHGNLNYNLSDLIDTYHPNIIVFEIVQRCLQNYNNSFELNEKLIDLKIQPYLTELNGRIESVVPEKDKVTINGWGYIPEVDAGLSNIYVMLSNKTHTLIFTTSSSLRPEIKDSSKDVFHLGLAGFMSRILLKDIPEGTYRISLIIENSNKMSKKEFHDKFIIKTNGNVSWV